MIVWTNTVGYFNKDIYLKIYITLGYIVSLIEPNEPNEPKFKRNSREVQEEFKRNSETI